MPRTGGSRIERRGGGRLPFSCNRSVRVAEKAGASAGGAAYNGEAGGFNAGIAGDARRKDRAGALVRGPVSTVDSAAADASALDDA